MIPFCFYRYAYQHISSPSRSPVWRFRRLDRRVYLSLRATGLWQHRDFLKLWGGQSFSLFGSLVSRVALPFVVIYALQARPVEVSWVRAAEVAPGILFALIAGVWIDRFPRRRVMLWADLLRAALTASIPLALWLERLTLTHLIVVAALGSILSICFDVAYESYLPSLVEPEQVVEANSKLTATAAVAEVAGFSLAGLLYQWLGAALTLAIDSASYVVSALTLFWIRRPDPPPRSQSARMPVLTEVREGLRVLAERPVLLALGGVEALSSLYVGVLGTVYVLFVSRELGVAPGLQGLIYAVGGVSALVGASLAEPLARRFGLGRVLVGAWLVGLLAIALVPLAAGPLPLIVGLLVVQQGIGDGADTVVEIHVTSLRQRLTPEAFRGRVGAAWRLTGWLFLLAGLLGGGVLADQIGIRSTLLGAIAVRGASLALMAGSPLRRLPMGEVDAAPLAES